MRDLTIKLVQADLAWEDSAANLHKLENLIGKEKDDTIFVLPEMFATGFTMNPAVFAQKMDGEAVQWMIKNSENCVICGSLSIEEHGKYYNRFLWVENGNVKYYYDKRHLFSHGTEHLHYSPGENRICIEYQGWKILPFVCYDLRFPVWCRNVENAELMLFVANWPKVRVKAWERLLQARAIENQCFVVGVNRVGVDGNNFEHNGSSAALDPWGDAIVRNEGDEVVLTAVLEAEKLLQFREHFPVLKEKDTFRFNH